MKLIFNHEVTVQQDKETWNVLVKWMSGITNYLIAPGLASSQTKAIKVHNTKFTTVLLCAFVCRPNITGNGLPADVYVAEITWKVGHGSSVGVLCS